MTHSRSRWKNRIQATLDQCGLRCSSADSFGPGGRLEIRVRMDTLLDETRECDRRQLEPQEQIEGSINQLESRPWEILEDSAKRDWLRTIPGIAPIPSATIMLELGGVSRISVPADLASDAGTTSRIHPSGQTRNTGFSRKEAHQTLVESFKEAAKIVIRPQKTD